MINLTWLKTFCTLAELGHFTKTADKLHMTQSGVSQQIKKLESHLRCQLLIRQGKTFSLTNAGQELRRKGLQLLNSSTELETDLKQDDAHKGTVRIASPGGVGLSLYPVLLEYQLQHKSLSVDYVFAPNTDIETALLEFKIDIGLITNLPTQQNIRYKKVSDEPLVLVTANKVKKVDWQTLLHLGFVSHPDGPFHGQQLLGENFEQFEHVEQFEHRGFSNQISLILQPVSLGIGFTVLPLSAAKAFKNQSLIHIHQLKRSVNESLFLCANRHHALPKRVQEMQSVIRQKVA